MYRIDPALARLFKLGLDADMSEKIEGWQRHLDSGEMTEEMRTVFYGLGYLSSLRDPRVKPAEPEAEAEADGGLQAVELSEPKARPKRGIGRDGRADEIVSPGPV